MVVEGRRVELEVRHGNDALFLDCHLLMSLHGLELYGDANGLRVEALQPRWSLLGPGHDRLHEVGKLVEVLHGLCTSKRWRRGYELRIGNRIETDAVKRYIRLALAAEAHSSTR